MSGEKNEISQRCMVDYRHYSIYTTCLSSCEWMNEWVSEWVSEWVNEWMNEWIPLFSVLNWNNSKEPLNGNSLNKLKWVVIIQIGPLQDPVTWYRINYAGTQITQWDFQTQESRAGLVRVSLFWKSHCIICNPQLFILYHVTRSCRAY